MASENPVHQLSNEPVDELCATALNDKIVSLSILRCKKCGKFLNSPIMLVPNIGNICGNCIKDDTNIRIQNKALDAILDFLLIPCHYYEAGCAEKLPKAQIPLHAAVCRYRSYACPLKLFGDCMWTGRSNDLVQHSKCHHEYYFVSKESNIQFTFDVSKNDDIIRFMSICSTVFVLHIVWDLQTLNQHYAVYYIGSPDKRQNFKYCLTLTGDNELELGSNNITQYTDLEHLDKDVLTVDLSVIKSVLKDNFISVQIKIANLNDPKDLNIEDLSSFECPVCINYMRPPIFQCISGHSICNKCRPSVTQCPVCRSRFGPTRNFALESICAKTKFPCINHDLGCNIALIHSELDMHESRCDFKSYNCPFNDWEHCTWVEPLDGLIYHLKLQHSSKVILTNYKSTIVFPPPTGLFSTYCLIFNEEVFRVGCKYDHNNLMLYWSVQLVGPAGEANNYISEIGLIDGKNQYRRFIRTYLVQDLSGCDNMFNACVMIPTSVLSSYNLDGNINYYCKISKIK